MKVETRMAAVWAAAMAILVSAPAAAESESQFEGIEVVEVRTRSGDVRIRPSDGGGLVAVEGRPRKTDIRREGSTLQIEGGSSGLKLTVPDGLRVEVDTRSGDCDIEGRFAQLTLTTFSGSGRLRVAAELVEIRTLSGDLDIDMKARMLRVSAVSGDIEVQGEIRDANLKTTSGDLVWSTPILPLRLDLQTVSGDVVMKGDLPGDAYYRMHSTSGDLTLVRKNRQGFRIDAQTYSGEIRLPGRSSRQGRDARKVSTVVDGGGADLRIETFSGTIRVADR